MKRYVVTGAAVLIGTMCMRPALADDDAIAVKETIKKDYFVFYPDQDQQKYRSLLTDDYLLLENGDILDIEGDVALMPPADSDYKRSPQQMHNSTRAQFRTDSDRKGA